MLLAVTSVIIVLDKEDIKIIKLSMIIFLIFINPFVAFLFIFCLVLSYLYIFRAWNHTIRGEKNSNYHIIVEKRENVLSESVFRHKDQLSFDSLFDELTEENSQEESQNNIRFIHRKRKSFPFHLVADFNRFMEFIAHRSILLSETTSYMSGNQLSEINNRLTINVLKETEQTKQQHYPYVHFFYNISLAGNLTEIQTTNSGELKLMTTAKLKLC